MAYYVALALAVGFGLPLAVLSAAIGQGKTAAAALEGIARQPEAAGKIQMAMIIALALIESLVIYALLMFLMLFFGRMPSTEDLLNVARAQAGMAATASAAPATPAAPAQH